MMSPTAETVTLSVWIAVSCANTGEAQVIVNRMRANVNTVDPD
jgi:hypothetical protein